jgi:hypothetical protein
MKARHVAAIVVGAALVVWGLASCNLLNPVSIQQRIDDFLADLNTSTRTNIGQNFHPTATTEYAALQDPNLSGINTTFPVGSYSSTTIDQSNPSGGVIVQISGPNAVLSSPYFLKLTMQTTNSNDWRIVTLSLSQINGSYPPPLYF